MKTYLYLLVVLLGTGLAGCKIVAPQVSGVRNFSLADDPGGNKALKMEIRVNNPNRVGFRVSDPAFEVFLNGTRIGIAQSDKKIRIKARSNDYHTIYLGTDIRSLSGALAPLLSVLSSGKIQFEAKGQLKARCLGQKRVMGIGVSENLNLEDIIK